jgi:hypothetical protein
MKCSVRLLNGDIFESSTEPYALAIRIFQDYRLFYPDPPILFEQLAFSSEKKGNLHPYQLDETDTELFLMIRPLPQISYLNLYSRIELCEKALPSFLERVHQEPDLRLYTWIDPDPLSTTYYVTQLVSSTSSFYPLIDIYYQEKVLSDGDTVVVTLALDMDSLPTESSSTVGITYIYQQRLEWLKMIKANSKQE